MLFIQARTPKHKKSVAYVYTEEHGSKKLLCSSLQIQWVAHRMIALSGDTEVNPGPFTQTNNEKNVSCIKSVNSVSLLESRLSQLGRLPVSVSGDGNCFFHAVSCQLYNTSEYHFYIRILGVQHLLHHPELYIESNFEQSWQSYVNNMAKQGTWADNIIIQAVANSLNVTINMVESNANFSPVTVINPINTNGQTTNIFIGHIQEYHYMATMPVLNSLTPEMTCADGLIQTSVSSHETIVEQYEESHFLVKEKSELVDEERNDKKGANISEVEKTVMRKASEREYIQQTEKLKNRKTSKPEFMQNKRVQAVKEVKDNHKKIKLSEVDKTGKRKASKREFIQKKRAKAVNKGKESQRRLKLSEVDKAEKRKASKREFMQKKRAKAVNKGKDSEKRLKLSEVDKAEMRKASKREYIQKKRQNADYRQQENRQRINNRITSKREYVRQKRENMQKQKDTNNNCSTVFSDCGENYANACISMITKFHESISQGPEYICTCCDQLWYKTSVRKCNTTNYTSYLFVEM